LILSRLYAIADAEMLSAGGASLEDFVRELRAAGVGWVQYRDKVGPPQEVLRAAEVLREAMMGSGCKLILNDRADLAVLAGFDGVHVGRGDLSVADARSVIGWREATAKAKEEADSSAALRNDKQERQVLNRIVGVSTHTDAQVRAAERSCADYIAIGPVFATGTKADAEAVVGLDGVRRARALTRKPLVAIGGITRANARSVIDAGADSVAVISGLLAEGESVEKVARDFLELLG
jgi:thiamine-phosphate pyrophosphorylase